MDSARRSSCEDHHIEPAAQLHGGMCDRQAGQEKVEAEQRGPFRHRPRSDVRLLPLSVQESFYSLKEELWGKKGVHKATRLHVRSSWQEKVSTLALVLKSRQYNANCCAMRTATAKFSTKFRTALLLEKN